MTTENFKIHFPAGYVINDSVNDNLDMHVVLETDEVFFATAITAENIKYLMDKDSDVYFWCVDMFVVKDLKKDTIRSAVRRAREDEYFKFIFCKIGSIEKIYGEGWTFDKVTDMTFE